MADPISPAAPPVTPPASPIPPTGTPPAVPPSESTSPPTTPAPADYDQGEDVFTNWVRWKCLVCGYVYEGDQPKAKAIECPRCHNNNPDKFADVD